MNANALCSATTFEDGDHLLRGSRTSQPKRAVSSILGPMTFKATIPTLGPVFERERMRVEDDWRTLIHRRKDRTPDMTIPRIATALAILASFRTWAQASTTTPEGVCFVVPPGFPVCVPHDQGLPLVLASTAVLVLYQGIRLWRAYRSDNSELKSANALLETEKLKLEIRKLQYEIGDLDPNDRSRPLVLPEPISSQVSSIEKKAIEELSGRDDSIDSMIQSQLEGGHRQKVHFLRRSAAFAIDYLAFATTVIVASVAVQGTALEPVLLENFILGFWGGFLVYFLGLHSLFGITFGKLVLGLRLVDAKGNKPAFLANVTRLLVWITNLCWAFCFWFAVGDRKVPLHDRVAGTRVVYVR